MLTESERSAILDAEVQRYVALGFHVTSRTATTAQLVKPKRFDAALAVLGLLFLAVGLLAYLLVYLGQSDERVYLTVDVQGQVDRAGNARSTSKLEGWACPTCGYANHRARTICKRCRQPHQSSEYPAPNA